MTLTDVEVGADVFGPGQSRTATIRRHDAATFFVKVRNLGNQVEQFSIDGDGGP